MGNSFVLFDVSMAIDRGDFTSGITGYTSKTRLLWLKGLLPWLKDQV